MSKLEGWLPRIAVATFAYYLLTFAFEIGYFWQVGAGYMPAFTIAEHAVHAASFIIVGLGVIVIGYFVSLYPALGLRTTDSHTPFQPPPKDEKIPIIRRLSFFALLAVFVATFGWDEMPRILREGFSPISLFGMLFSVAMMAYFAMLSFRLPKIFWVYPAIIATIILPTALGQLSYNGFTRDSDAIYVTVTVSGKPVRAKVIFFGTDQMLVATPKVTALVDYPDDAVTLN